jgi:hypothetical protein
MEHGSYRGDIAWGEEEPPVIPCPKCGEEPPMGMVRRWKEAQRNGGGTTGAS